MVANLLDGKKISAIVYEDIKKRCENLSRIGIKPGLATVLVGDDPASHVYVGQKIKKCKENGLESIHVSLPANVSQQELMSKVEALNNDLNVHGIIVQLPLPKNIESEKVINLIRTEKDADGLHPLNQGLMGRLKSWSEIEASGIPLPCTPHGVIYMLLNEKISISGKHIVIVGRSSLVGKPLYQMFLSLDATVTVAHSRTQNLDEMCRSADILIAAIGKPEVVKGSWIKPGAVVVDVGISRTPQGLKGDVEFATAVNAASWITPVPGGVGVMTVAMLLHNTVKAAERRLLSSARH